MTLNRS